MNKSLKKIWNVVSSILVAVVVILALLLVGARVMGLQVFTVLSGSMEPTYHTGSLIYVKKTDPYTIKEGQPITFMLDENTIATHRVVGIVPDEEDPAVIRFRTKGDANDTEDVGWYIIKMWWVHRSSPFPIWAMLQITSSTRLEYILRFWQVRCFCCWYLFPIYLQTAMTKGKKPHDAARLN